MGVKYFYKSFYKKNRNIAFGIHFATIIYRCINFSCYMEELNIKPLGDRVVVKSIENPKKTSGGIIIPDSIKEKPQEGIVVAVGPGKKDEPMVLKVGDKVLYSKYGGTELKICDCSYLIMRVSDVYAIV